jgi:hypothetical protein
VCNLNDLNSGECLILSVGDDNENKSENMSSFWILGPTMWSKHSKFPTQGSPRIRIQGPPTKKCQKHISV